MTVAVLGAGVMGRTIARAYLEAGIEVYLFSRSTPTLDAASRSIGTASEGRLQLTTSVEEAVHDAAFVLETVPEVLALKQDMLRRIECASAATTIIGTNTSSLPLEQLARGLARPQLFAGVHWFNPAHLIPLVEVVPTKHTDAAVIERIVASLVEIGKRPLVLQRALPGFIVNRLQYALIREALQLIEEGVVTPEQIDLALTDCLGLRWALVGPMRTTDLAGISTAIAAATALYPTLAANTVPQQVLLTHGAQHTTFYAADTMDEAIRARDDGLVEILALRAATRVEDDQRTSSSSR